MVATAALLLVFALAAVLLIRPGVSEVIADQTVRSPQPSVAELRQLIGRYGLKTVISLRSTGANNQWLREERALCDDLGVRHVALSFEPDGWPARHQSVRLVRILDSTERPVLLHCLRGIDRSGFASATARLLAGQSVKRALAELSLRRGHLCVRSLCPVHRFFGLYLGHLNQTDLEHSSATFRTWVISEYCPPPYDAELALLDQPPPKASAGSSLRLRVRAHNSGHRSWRFSEEKLGVRLGARLVGPSEETPAQALAIFRSSNHLARDVARADLTKGFIRPGDEGVFVIEFPSPASPGLYVIQLDMVDELVHWFSDLGRPGILLQLEVTPPH